MTPPSSRTDNNESALGEKDAVSTRYAPVINNRRGHRRTIAGLLVTFRRALAAFQQKVKQALDSGKCETYEIRRPDCTYHR